MLLRGIDKTQVLGDDLNSIFMRRGRRHFIDRL
jgi:hypothetical protein